MSSSSSSQQLLSLLDGLPPSKEVLDFYRAKVANFEEEEKGWMRKLSGSRSLVAKMLALEEDKDLKEREVAALQVALVEMQAAVAAERKRTAKVEAEHNRVKIRERDNRRMIYVLLELCGKTEAEVAKMVEEVDREERVGKDTGDKEDHVGVFVPDKLRRYIKESKKHGAKNKQKRSAESLRIELATLECQLVEQERCHSEQVSALENERRKLLGDRDGLREQFGHKIRELSEHIKSMDDSQEELTQELIKVRSNMRRSERSWMAEKETLHRKLQFLQHYGNPAGASAAHGDLFTDQRSALRLGGEQRLRKQIQQLNSDLAEQKSLAETYRAQLLATETEIDGLRDQSSASKKALQRRTKAMVEQVDTLRDRYESLEKRKRAEAQGYQSDIRLLQQKMKQVEQQLVRSAVAKAKEHDYIKSIRSLEKELSELKTSVKNAGVWIT